MRNTYVPLDMLFIAVDGHIVKIAHAIPHDETTISSDVVVNGVIELRGGISDTLHLKVGDIAKWKLRSPRPVADREQSRAPCFFAPKITRPAAPV